MTDGKSDNGFILCIFVHSGTCERVESALTIANVALAMDGEVHMLFVYDALRQLVRADEASLEKPLAQPLHRQLEEGHMASLRDMIALGKRFGRLYIYACANSMGTQDVARNELIDEVDRSMGLVEFLRIVRQATTTLYI